MYILGKFNVFLQVMFALLSSVMLLNGLVVVGAPTPNEKIDVVLSEIVNMNRRMDKLSGESVIFYLIHDF